MTTKSTVLVADPETLVFFDKHNLWTIASYAEGLPEQSRKGFLSALRHAIEHVRARARADQAQLMNAGRVLTCVFCGKEYEPGSPTHGTATLREHVIACEFHPMRAAVLERDRLSAENLELRARLADFESAATDHSAAKGTRSE